MTEFPVVLDCSADRMIGIVHRPERDATTGVVIVVGGPQYRAGSHRQFVIMARALADAGIPVMRFDYRGMGDSEGAERMFDAVDEDIRCAADGLVHAVPSVEKIVLLGLCDAASAGLIYAACDKRVQGLVLMNPWVRTPQGEAQAYLRYYYLKRLLRKSFWRKVLSGEFAVMQSVRQFVQSLRKSRAALVSDDSSSSASSSFIDRMLSGWTAFCHPVLILISERDLTAKEFTDLCKKDRNWRACLQRSVVTMQHLPDADHTMSSRQHLQEASDVSIKWLKDEVGV